MTHPLTRTLAVLMLLTAAGRAAGQPPTLTVFPAQVALTGGRAEQQLVVTLASGQTPLRDQTHQAKYTSLNPKVVAVSPAGLVTPRGNGSAVVVVKAAGVATQVKVTVAGVDRPDPVAFATQVIPTLTKAGCNAGACHGTPTGKGGFKLSLRGYLPDQDFDSLTRDAQGRRVDRLRPEESLLLRKATGSVPHEGGMRFAVDAPPYRLLRDWVGEGTSAQADPPRLLHLEVFPPQRLLEAPAEEQQLAVSAVFADGSRRDVTGLTRFTVSNPDVADVSPGGHVRARTAGEVTVLANYLHAVAGARLTFLRPVPGFAWQAPAPKNFIDQHVFAKLKLLRIKPSALSADEVFLRRVYLDVCGILPTPAETKAFLASQDPAKRAKLIDALLQRPECADVLALQWVDRLGCNNRFVGQRGAYTYRQWIFDQVNRDVPFDQFVRSVITASGPSYSEPAASFYRRIRSPETRVEAVAHLFLGVRIGCAKCHNHPAERWTQDDYYGLAAFFPRVRYKNGPTFIGIYNKEETVWLDREGEVTHPRTGQLVRPKVLGGPVVAVAEHEDRRVALAQWVTHPDNPFFARLAVNRLWHQVMGRGLVEPVDDFRESNPAAHPELLDALAADFVKHKFDVKHTLRTILNSATYQLSFQPNDFNKHDEVYFSRYGVRRLTAEQFVDSVCQVCETVEKFKGVPPGTRAAQLPDGELFHPFLKALGKPARAIECACEREPDVTLEQVLMMSGGLGLHQYISAENGLAHRLSRSKASAAEVAEEVVLRALCRPPTPPEREILTGHLTRQADRRRAVEDILWAVINHREFMFQH